MISVNIIPDTKVLPEVYVYIGYIISDVILALRLLIAIKVICRESSAGFLNTSVANSVDPDQTAPLGAV